METKKDTSNRRKYPAVIISAARTIEFEAAAYMGGISHREWASMSEEERKNAHQRIAEALCAMRRGGTPRLRRERIGEWATREYAHTVCFQMWGQAVRDTITMAGAMGRKADTMRDISTIYGIQFQDTMVRDAGRKEQLVRAYARNGNDDGEQLASLIIDAVRPTIYTYMTHLRRDHISAEAMIDTETADHYPRPVFIPLYILETLNPRFNTEREPSKFNPRTVNVYSRIWRDMEDEHRRIFYTDGPSLDAQTDATNEESPTLGETIDAETASARLTPEEKIISQDTADEVRAAYSIIGKTDAEISQLLSKCTQRDQYGNLIAADPATAQNLITRARLILRAPSEEIARALHSLNLGAGKELVKSGHQLLSLLIPTYMNMGEVTRKSADAALSAHMEEARKRERNADPEALKEALRHLDAFPQAPIPPAIMARLTPAQKRQVSAARRKNERSRTELFRSEAQLDSLKRAFYSILSKYEAAHRAMIETFTSAPLDDTTKKAREEGKTRTITTPSDPTGPAEYATPAIIPLSTRGARIMRRMKRNAPETEKRLREAQIITSADDPATVATKIASAEVRRYGEKPDEEVRDCLLYFVMSRLYHLIIDARRDVLKWSPTMADVKNGLRTLLSIA